VATISPAVKTPRISYTAFQSFATLGLYVNQSGITDANGARLYFEMAGSGEALVFIHGLGLDARMWDLQCEVFAQRFSVIRYDLRGFGRSSVPTAEGYSHAEDLHALLRFLRVQQAHILGLSFGGRHAVNFGLLYDFEMLIQRKMELYPATVHGSRSGRECRRASP
jgi:pimeloyl-ACP methyl ester carboxylesterase